jgi:hypothetical protein
MFYCCTGALWGWFSRSSATFGNGIITVRNSPCGIGRSQRVAYSDIRQVTRVALAPNDYLEVLLKTSQEVFSIVAETNHGVDA